MPDSSHFAVAIVCFATGFLASTAYIEYKHGYPPWQRHHQGRYSRKRLYIVFTGQPSESTIGKSSVVAQAGFSSAVISSKLLREALLQVKQEESPKTPEHKEAYFVTQVNVGELLATQGPEFHLAAAIAFFKALRIHPMPMDLVMIYQIHVPEPIFKAGSGVTDDANW